MARDDSAAFGVRRIHSEEHGAPLPKGRPLDLGLQLTEQALRQRRVAQVPAQLGQGQQTAESGDRLCGIAEPVRRFGAGRVVPPGDVDALAAAVHELLTDPVALDQARAGARRAREQLTWDTAARAHLAIYEEIA